MVRTYAAADFLTLGNGFAGTGALMALVQHVATGDDLWLWMAFSLFPIALILDFLDGRVARAFKRSSPIGADLDSLADVVSFGVAPALLAFVLGMRGPLDVVALLFFVGCGISRLARFNVTAADMADETGKVKYFEGTPIPTSGVLVVVLFVCALLGRTGDALPLGAALDGALHPLVLMYVVSGCAMISKTLRIPKP